MSELLQVVILDDDRAQRNLVEQVLHYCAPVQVTTAASVTEAKLVLEDFQPDGLILDLVLEDGSGLELGRLAQRRGIPVVYYTSSDDLHNLNLMYETGGFVVAKPMSLHAAKVVLNYFAVTRRAYGQSN